MIDNRFLKSAACLCLLVLAPAYEAKATDSEIQKTEIGLYGRVFNITKLSGESNFMDTGLAAINAWNDAHTSKPDGYLNGAVVREFRPTHGFNMMGIGLAVGYHIQETRIELEALVNGAGKVAERAEETFYGVADVPSDLPTETNKDKKLDGIQFVPVGPMQFTDFSYKAGLLNVYHDFSAGKVLNMFVGGGIGLAKVKYKLSEAQELVSTPFIAQGKIGISFDVDYLRKAGVVPYLGYTARYFTETKTKEPVTGLGVIRSKLASGGLLTSFLSDYDVEKSPVEGVNFVPVAKHLLHNLEVGFTFLLDA
ncbi:P44/Msp2 family outer membrane protein [Neorickettsia findlayensis]|uniref:P44/Msp2 family outer membrane protein n=2 Tax=Neorickettsia TaxID=33993 RepID=A0A6P1GAZ5_9RICK|nr:P44/Msp2 family outer membrane protein [Neorickettsia findlayensis]AEK71067.1 surface protein 2 [Neorickettsia risticii]QHD65470.1 P44/Msp2 family outer membrane protein [Neorickettsia findlayensis]